MKKILAIACLFTTLLNSDLKEDLYFHIQQKLYDIKDLESNTADFLDSNTHLFLKGIQLSYYDILYILEKYESKEIFNQ